MIYSAFLSPAPKALANRPPIRENVFLVAPMVVLALFCVVLGLRPELAVELAIVPAIAGAATTGGGVSSGAGVLETSVGLWGPAPAMWLILIGGILGAALVWIATRPARVRVVRPFIGGEVPLGWHSLSGCGEQAGKPVPRQPRPVFDCLGRRGE